MSDMIRVELTRLLEEEESLLLVWWDSTTNFANGSAKHCISLTVSLPLQFGCVTRMGREANMGAFQSLTTAAD